MENVDEDMEHIETPEWLTELLQDIAECFECTPPNIGWRIWWANAMPGWEAEIYPGPMEIEGKSSYPNASINLREVLDLFPPFDDGTGGGVRPPDIIWGMEEGAVSIFGGMHGQVVQVNVMLQAPEDVPAMTRLLPGGQFAWQDIPSPDEEDESVSPEPN